MSLQSMPYRPAQCCEKCVFGSGEHAEWCNAWRDIVLAKARQLGKTDLFAWHMQQWEELANDIPGTPK